MALLQVLLHAIVSVNWKSIGAQTLKICVMLAWERCWEALTQLCDKWSEAQLRVHFDQSCVNRDRVGEIGQSELTHGDNLEIDWIQDCEVVHLHLVETLNCDQNHVFRVFLV